MKDTRIFFGISCLALAASLVFSAALFAISSENDRCESNCFPDDWLVYDGVCKCDDRGCE